jgi:Icc-related predicted phosphoesterase
VTPGAGDASTPGRTRAGLPLVTVAWEGPGSDAIGAAAGDGLPDGTVRLAAVGDLHVAEDSVGLLRPRFERLAEHADLLLLAGDLTHRGRPVEADVLCGELCDLSIPIVAVLGNHDYHSDQHDEVARALRRAGTEVLEGDAIVVEVRGTRVGIAGTKGFGGGFPGATASEFGEPEQREFARLARTLAGRLQAALASIGDADVRVALLHYAPIEGTLQGEPKGIFAFLGSYLFAKAVDHAGADLVLHGHAHRGTRAGSTPGGIPVRNVAMPVIGSAYDIFEFDVGAPAGATERRAIDRAGP